MAASQSWAVCSWVATNSWKSHYSGRQGSAVFMQDSHEREWRVKPFLRQTTTTDLNRSWPEKHLSIYKCLKTNPDWCKGKFAAHVCRVHGGSHGPKVQWEAGDVGSPVQAPGNPSQLRPYKTLSWPQPSTVTNIWGEKGFITDRNRRLLTFYEDCRACFCIAFTFFPTLIIQT